MDDADDIQVEQGVLAEAVKKGYLHVDMPMTNRKQLSKAETLDVSSEFTLFSPRSRTRTDSRS